MKCKLPTRDGTECGADLSHTEEYCANCGGNVEIDESTTKTCPSCPKRLRLKDKFCTACRFSFEDETKKIICEAKKEDGTKCNGELSPSNKVCSTCGTSLRRLRKEDGNGKPISHEPSAEGDKPAKRGLAVVCSHSNFTHGTHKLRSRESAVKDHAMMKSLWDLYGCHVIDFKDMGSNFYDTKLIGKIEEELKKIENIEIFVFVLSSHGEEKEEKRLRTDEQGTFQHYFFTNDGQFSTQDLMNKIAKIEKLDSKLKIFVIQACRSRTGAEDQNEDHGVEFEFELEEGSDLFGGQNDGTVHPDAKGYMPDEDKMNDESDDKRQNGSSGRPDTKPDAKRQNDGIDQSDARGYMSPEDEDEEVTQQHARGDMPHEDEKNNEPGDKRQDDGIDKSDARSSMPPEDEDEDEEVMQQPNVASGRTEAQGEIKNEIENSKIDLPPIEVVPHCDDCVVMFASMSGKYAYSRLYSEHYSGGWLIKSVDKILKKYEKGDQPHILDILVEINREVGTRESKVERDTWEILDDLESEIKMEGLQPRLKNRIDKLREKYREHSSKVEIKKCQDVLNELATKIDQNGHTEDSLNSIKKETVHFTEKFKQELLCVTLKAQSSFFHNLAFDLFLCKMK